jgi:hypothetical protein
MPFRGFQLSAQHCAADGVYIALLLVLWPLIKTTSALAAVFALLPVVPMIAALWLIARRVMDSDNCSSACISSH